ncbi:hypothetical protein [Novosphingobium huizhouense]|uniref:hypothetical protein n=1 Tax=Novosphingobium huizhouense TaxID=2866625 RepID=UPI001CD826BA|nr:hypothetical protein [Novosphingobium huizhouense]
MRVPARATDAQRIPLADDGRVRGAIAACIAAAEQAAPGSGADAIDVTQVEPRAGGYRIAGRVAVNRLGRPWQAGDRVYGRGWRGDFRGWTPALRGYDAVRFTCAGPDPARPAVTFD